MADPPRESTADVLEDRILRLLRDQPWRKANEVAAALGVDRRAVNSVFYGSLKHRLVQDRRYRWALREEAERHEDAGTEGGAPPATPIHRLCRYYLDCIDEEGNNGISVFATSFREVDYAFIPGTPESLGACHTEDLPAEGRRILSACSGRRSQSALRIGYPTVYVRRTSRRGDRFGKIEPLLVWAIDPATFRQRGLSALAEDAPSLNIEAVATLSREPTSTALEGLLHLQRELGLDQLGDGPPELDELASRLRSLRPDWPWEDCARFDGAMQDLPFDDLPDIAVLDRFVLVATERSPYTQGLETELSELARRAEAITQSTAIRNWVIASFESGLPASSPTLLEVVPLNSEQRHAVESALTRPLTVITGPPGTGKSQVVTAILVNAARAGMRVLFASKNNRAVDVVEQRVHGLGPRPFLLRLGAREYQSLLQDYLVRMLAVTATAEDRQDYEEARTQLAGIRKQLEELDRERDLVIELRNRVDRLEQDSEQARGILEPAVFGRSRTLEIKRAAAAADSLNRALDGLDRRKAGLFTRLFWLWLRKARLAAAAACLDELRPPARELGLALPRQVPDEESLDLWTHFLADFRTRMQGAEKAGEYLRGLDGLEKSRTLEQILDCELDLRSGLEELSARLWHAWLRIQPSELSLEQRKLLSEYVSVLQLLVQGRDEEQQSSKQVWARYYQASQKVVSILPCWAVTSLSAKGRIPLEPGVFDLLVVDEASQCDIASAIPLLYRAKRTVVIGDPNQLKHISALSRSKDQQLLEKHELVEGHLSWSYSVNSLFDLASGLCRSEDLIQLRDHHRSHPDIIGFSNDEFYEGRLRLATRLRNLRPLDSAGPSVRWIQVRGNAVRPSAGGLRNDEEASRVVEELRRILVDQRYEGSIGIVSPFRDQVNRIRDLVARDDEISSRLDAADLMVETVHKFQGDERDLMIFSPTISAGAIDRAAGFLKSTANLFNVAITRARATLIVVGDAVAAREAGVGHLHRFSDYVAGLKTPVSHVRADVDLGPNYPPVSNPHQVSDWEKTMYRALYHAGLRPIPQYAEEKYVLDLALLDGDRRLDIEVDGERYHRAWDGELCRRDRLRNMRLIELGWDVMRFWVYQVRDDLDGCVRRVRDWKDGRDGGRA